jgi:hypothetical protein
MAKTIANTQTKKEEKDESQYEYKDINKSNIGIT